MRTAFLVNPYAGGGRCFAEWKRLEPSALRTFPGAQVLRTSRPGEESELAVRARHEGAELLVTVGGDGTLSGAVHGLLNEEGHSGEGLPAVAPLALGTGGDVARGLGYPEDPQESLEMLVSARHVWVDAGKLTFPESSGEKVRFWVNQSYIGLGAEVVDRVNTAPRWRGGHSYVFSSLLEAMHAKPLDVSLVGEGVPSTVGPVVNLLMANGRFSGKGMLTSPTSDPADGALEIITIDPMPRLRLLRGLGKFRTGAYLSMEGVTQWKATELEVRGPPALVEADGEIVGKLPVRISLVPKSFVALVPSK